MNTRGVQLTFRIFFSSFNREFHAVSNCEAPAPGPCCREKNTLLSGIYVMRYVSELRICAVSGVPAIGVTLTYFSTVLRGENGGG